MQEQLAQLRKKADRMEGSFLKNHQNKGICRKKYHPGEHFAAPLRKN